MSLALCLSTSILALAVAGMALFESRSGGPGGRGTVGQDDHELQGLLKSLQKEVAELRARQDSILQPSVERRKSGTRGMVQTGRLPAADPGEPGGLQEKVAALAERLATLENEENIARLAQSGSRQMEEKEIKKALDRIGDPGADPEERLGALERLRRAGKEKGEMVKQIMGENGLQERDLYLPMLDLARDTTLDSRFRAEVIRNFQGSRAEELRQPMLDLLASYDVPEVRREALTTLFWYIDDATVRETIKQASREDPQEEVRAATVKILPKIKYMEKEAAGSRGAANPDK
jgi:hypothetical protein